MAEGLDTTRFMEDNQPALRQLWSVHQADLPHLELLDSYYNGEQPLSYMAPELFAELADRMRQVVINWPMLVVDSLEERLDVEGFRMGGAAEASEDLWDFWQANGLDLGAHQAQVDALTMGRSYLCVGERGTDLDPSSGVDSSIPLITVESPLEMCARRDPRTGRVRDSARWWGDNLDGKSRTDHSTLYLPNTTSWWVKKGQKWVIDWDGSEGIDEHNLGVVPVVPIVNRPRTSAKKVAGGEGRSELDPVIPLSDAACKIATDMMVAAESHAVPRRYASGVDRADFYDADGNPKSHLSRLVDKIWANESETVKFGQFSASDLSNFHNTIKTLAQVVAGLCGLPPHYLGLSTENPASADAIRSSEARHVKRAERRHRTFGEPYERAMRIAILISYGVVPEEARRMETLWRDAATPTVAQKADAAVKLRTVGIISIRQAREDLGYSSTQIERMEEDDEREAAVAFGEKMPAKGDPAAMDPATDPADPSVDPEEEAA